MTLVEQIQSRIVPVATPFGTLSLLPHSMSETITLPNGAKQSKISGAWYLLDACILVKTYCNKKGVDLATALLGYREGANDLDTLLDEFTTYQKFLICAEVMEAGVLKYGEDNWRGIPLNDHITHAISHFIAYAHDSAGEDSEDYRHFICRTYMAIAVALRPGFTGRWKPTDPGWMSSTAGDIKITDHEPEFSGPPFASACHICGHPVNDHAPCPNSNSPTASQKSPSVTTKTTSRKQSKSTPTPSSSRSKRSR